MQIPWEVIARCALLACIAAIGYFCLVARGALAKQVALLCEDEEALRNARVILAKARNEAQPPAAQMNLLRGGVSTQSVIGRRLNILATHHASNEYTPLDRMALMEGEAARFQSRTDEPRYWAGAFTFIGLIGTLVGLTLAVFHLMSVVNQASDAAAYSSSMEGLTRDMSATFSGMGGAFVCTIAGVIATLVLSKKVSNYERTQETFRLEFEEFSHLELEPLVGRARGVSAEGEEALRLNAVDLPDVVQNMERLVKGFNAGMRAALTGFQAVIDATGTTSGQLAVAASSFEAANAALRQQLDALGFRVDALASAAALSHEAQTSFLNKSGETISNLSSVVSTAQTTLAGFDEFRKQTAEDNETSRRVLRDTVEQLGLLHTKAADSHNAILDRVREEQRAAEAQQRAYSENIRQNIAAALEKINQSIGEGVEQERALVGRLEGVLRHLQAYTEHVENTVRDHLVALQAGPLVEFDAQNTQLTDKLIQSIQGLNQEISGLKGSFAHAGETISEVSRRVETVGSTQTMLHSDLTNVGAQVGQLSNRFAQMNHGVNRLEQSVLFTVDRLLGRVGPKE